MSGLWELCRNGASIARWLGQIKTECRERPPRRAAKEGELGKGGIWIFDLNWGV